MNLHTDRKAAVRQSTIHHALFGPVSLCLFVLAELRLNFSFAFYCWVINRLQHVANTGHEVSMVG